MESRFCSTSCSTACDCRPHYPFDLLACNQADAIETPQYRAFWTRIALMFDGPAIDLLRELRGG